MKKTIGIILIVISIGLGYLGITKFMNSGESVEVVGIELSAQDNSKKTTAFIYLGLAVVSFGGGIFLIRSS